MSAGPDSVTFTPGSTAFVPSATVPLIAPVVEVTVCDPATPANSAIAHAHVATLVMQLIPTLLSGPLLQFQDVIRRSPVDHWFTRSSPKCSLSKNIAGRRW